MSHDTSLWCIVFHKLQTRHRVYLLTLLQQPGVATYLFKKSYYLLQCCTSSRDHFFNNCLTTENICNKQVRIIILMLINNYIQLAFQPLSNVQQRNNMSKVSPGNPQQTSEHSQMKNTRVMFDEASLELEQWSTHTSSEYYIPDHVPYIKTPPDTKQC